MRSTAEPRPAFELVGFFLKVLRHFQQSSDGSFVAEAEGEATTMFGLLPQSCYLVVHHVSTIRDQILASALGPPFEDASLGDGRRAREATPTSKYRTPASCIEWGTSPIKGRHST